jgi:uncharacterized membrane protein YecN with MAPEG domain
MKTIMLYAGLLAVIYTVLTFRTIALRGKWHISLGYGGEKHLERAIRAHANFAEYVPFTLILLMMIAHAGAHPYTLHALGSALLCGRLFHALAVSRIAEPLLLRMAGMVLTMGAFMISGLLMLFAFANSFNA